MRYAERILAGTVKSRACALYQRQAAIDAQAALWQRSSYMHLPPTIVKNAFIQVVCASDGRLTSGGSSVVPFLTGGAGLFRNTSRLSAIRSLMSAQDTGYM